jgi:hypothetical protein
MDKLPVPRPDRESYVKHRREFTRQILLPVILVTLVTIGLAALTVYGTVARSENVSLWADIAAIWVILPLMLLMLVILAITVALIYGLRRLLQITPHYTGIAQDYTLWFNAEVRLWADKIVKPVLVIKSWLQLFIKSEEKNEPQS